MIGSKKLSAERLKMFRRAFPSRYLKEVWGHITAIESENSQLCDAIEAIVAAFGEPDRERAIDAATKATASAHDLVFRVKAVGR